MSVADLRTDITEYTKTLAWYAGKKGAFFGSHFEGAKSIVVDILKARRGTYQKPFLHVGMVFLTVVAVISAPIIVNEYPTSASSGAVLGAVAPSAAANSQTDITNIDTVTTESEKLPRDVQNYTVQGGDTVSSIAKKFSTPNNQIDVTSINYLNDFENDHVLRPGDTIKIPPTSGIIVTVKSGDTIASLAKKYGLLSSQPIVDWPYNDFANDETFALTAGQTLVIPGGKPPEVVPVAPVYRSVQSPTLFAGGSGQFIWPTSGIITQYFSGYHPADDIANSRGTPILAADSGRVISVLYDNYGYGHHVQIDHGNGYKTLYGHMGVILVHEGDNVSRGQQIGYMDSTGRSTGPHLHFEVYLSGRTINPLSVLK